MIWWRVASRRRGAVMHAAANRAFQRVAPEEQRVHLRPVEAFGQSSVRSAMFIARRIRNKFKAPAGRMTLRTPDIIGLLRMISMPLLRSLISLVDGLL